MCYTKTRTSHDLQEMPTVKVNSTLHEYTRENELWGEIPGPHDFLNLLKSWRACGEGYFSPVFPSLFP